MELDTIRGSASSTALGWRAQDWCSNGSPNMWDRNQLNNLKQILHAAKHRRLTASDTEKLDDLVEELEAATERQTRVSALLREGSLPSSWVNTPAAQEHQQLL